MLNNEKVLFLENQHIGYRYDGSFFGMLTCVFECFRFQKIPAVIQSVDRAATLLPLVNVLSDPLKAARVLAGIQEKIGRKAYDCTRACFLAEFPDKEVALCRYLKKGFEVGGSVNSLFSHDDVKPLLTGVRSLYKELGRFVEFLRFSDYNGNLVAEFEPEHNVLPLLVPHFTARFPLERFLIYDKTHGLAFVYADKKGKIISVSELDFPKLSEEEKAYRALWRAFYDTAAIEERKSERRRMQHLPKKFWKHMTEFLTDEPV